MARPQTIQIFLPDGSPQGIKEAELTNRLIKAILFPRDKMSEASRREMVNFTGVYFLFGTDDNSAKPIVYIGEGEDCFSRIYSHNRNKDFWTHCIIVASKTNEYTKTDVKFLEYLCLEKAELAGKYKTDNDTGSRKPSLPESREHDLLDNFETLKVLLSTLGYAVFDPEVRDNNDQSSELVFINTVGVKASAKYTDGGVLIYQGSEARLNVASSCHDITLRLRTQLLNEGALVEKNGKYVFTKNYWASSPSRGAAVITGASSNGWTLWKDKSGKTLDELKRR